MNSDEPMKCTTQPEPSEELKQIASTLGVPPAVGLVIARIKELEHDRDHWRETCDGETANLVERVAQLRLIASQVGLDYEATQLEALPNTIAMLREEPALQRRAIAAKLGCIATLESILESVEVIKSQCSDHSNCHEIRDQRERERDYWEAVAEQRLETLREIRQYVTDPHIVAYLAAPVCAILDRVLGPPMNPEEAADTQVRPTMKPHPRYLVASRDVHRHTPDGGGITERDVFIFGEETPVADVIGFCGRSYGGWADAGMVVVSVWDSEPPEAVRA